MVKVQYDDAAFRLKRLIKSIFDDKLVRIGIDDYDDALKTECLVVMFSNVLVVTSGVISKAKLAEMTWYGCNLEFFDASISNVTGGAASRLFFDCRQFVNDLNSNRV